MTTIEISEVVNFLMENYYSKYTGRRCDVVPTYEQAWRAICNHQDKVVVVKDDKIKGVGIFVTLTDETCTKLANLNITDVSILEGLIQEYGPHIHFVLLCAQGYKTIVTGMKQVYSRHRPKSISWWNPDMTKLHMYNMEGVE